MSRSVKYIRWQRISRKYQMRWKDIQRFPQFYPTHNTAYLKRNRRVWLWGWRRKKTMENVEMVIKHISWSHAPGTPRRFYTVKAKGSPIHAWHCLVFTNWQVFSKDVTMTGYWMRGYTKRAELITYPYDHSTSPEAYAAFVNAFHDGAFDHLLTKRWHPVTELSFEMP